MTNNEIAKVTAEIAKEAIKIAREEGDRERSRLGRDLTDGEVSRIADMIERQLKTALVMAR